MDVDVDMASTTIRAFVLEIPLWSCIWPKVSSVHSLWNQVSSGLSVYYWLDRSSNDWTAVHLYHIARVRLMIQALHCLALGHMCCQQTNSTVTVQESSPLPLSRPSSNPKLLMYAILSSLDTFKVARLNRCIVGINNTCLSFFWFFWTWQF